MKLVADGEHDDDAMLRPHIDDFSKRLCRSRLFQPSHFLHFDEVRRIPLLLFIRVHHTRPSSLGMAQ